MELFRKRQMCQKKSEKIKMSGLQSEFEEGINSLMLITLAPDSKQNDLQLGRKGTGVSRNLKIVGALVSSSLKCGLVMTPHVGVRSGLIPPFSPGEGPSVPVPEQSSSSRSSEVKKPPPLETAL